MNVYRVHFLNGVEVAREQVRSIIRRPPIARIEVRGTRVGPPKPVQARQSESGCDSNYSGGCVPVASDVDCGGGSGNGPEYVYGVVRVVGSDVYDLDRDGDGYGCD